MFGTIARGAAGLIGSALGAASLEGIASAIAGSPTENEARARVAPLFNREVAKLMATGMSYANAESHANEAISGHLQEEMSKSNLPEWAGTMLGVVGGIGGWSLGAKLAGKALTRMGAKAVAGEAGAGAAKAASLADAAVEDPLKKAAAGAVAEGSGKAAEGAAKAGPFPARRDFSFGGKVGGEPMMGADASGLGERGMEFKVRSGMGESAEMAGDYGKGMSRMPSGDRMGTGVMVDAGDVTNTGLSNAGHRGFVMEKEAELLSPLRGREPQPYSGRNPDARAPFPRLGMSVKSAPMDHAEEWLAENARHARKFPGRNPGYQARQLRELPFDERAYSEAMMRENPQGF